MAALAEDRQRFLRRDDLLRLIPRRIERYITSIDESSQIWGFDELFEYLDRETNRAHELREGIVNYFTASPDLRGHLSEHD